MSRVGLDIVLDGAHDNPLRHIPVAGGKGEGIGELDEVDTLGTRCDLHRLDGFACQHQVKGAELPFEYLNFSRRDVEAGLFVIQDGHSHIRDLLAIVIVILTFKLMRDRQAARTVFRIVVHCAQDHWLGLIPVLRREYRRCDDCDLTLHGSRRGDGHVG